jgi:hypothetical protein
MSKKTTAVILLIFLSLLAGCKKQITSDPVVASINSNEVYYTQFSLFQEKNNYRTTNYRKGILIPINTAITLENMTTGDTYVRLVDSGQVLRIENVAKHTGDDMQTAFDKIFAATKVNLSRFPAAQRDAIKAGRVIKGMSRKAVLAAIGYPPITETPTLDSNDWTYWAHRFNRFIVHFKNDKVDNIVD